MGLRSAGDSPQNARKFFLNKPKTPSVKSAAADATIAYGLHRCTLDGSIAYSSRLSGGRSDVVALAACTFGAAWAMSAGNGRYDVGLDRCSNSSAIYFGGGTPEGHA